jgi:hypothetical protein
MPFTADVTTDVGKVRLLIQDMDEDNPIFPDDAQIEAFLEIEGDTVKLAAALALESIAGNRALVLQVITLLDLRTDGQKVAQALLDTAKRWRETFDSGEDWAGFDIAQMVDNSDFVRREYLTKLYEAEGA